MLDDRGDSEVVGAILLVAVAVIAVSLIGVLVLSGITTDTPDTPVAEFNATVTDTTVTLTHLGGESIPLGDLTVVLRNQTTTTRYSPSTANMSDSANARFDSGERWTRTHDLTRHPHGFIEIRLVHTPSNEILVTRRSGA